ncbi:jacalin-related lectin 2-like [Ipomoea triloba]|uniref:jacalin-related lectin 2-like n=1 Tax=Ipomoea triloba TaxID=35885 RepID=UPI00125DA28F|nr:jacalin-related lectin 2-like [Ipomoea triloba]
MALKVEIMPAGCGKKWDDQSFGQVVGIVVHHNSSCFKSLRFIYVKDNVRQQLSKTYGEIGGKCEMIMLDYPTEFFIAVNGCYSVGDRIRCVTFVTNKATYGPFGQQRNNGSPEFSFKIAGNGPRNWISGFYGTVYDGDVETIGVYVQTETVSQPASFKSE